MTKLTVHIPDELHRRLKVVVAQEGTTMTSVVREGLEAYLARLALPAMIRQGGHMQQVAYAGSRWRGERV